MQKVFENEVNFTPERRRRRLTTALEPWTSSCSSFFFQKTKREMRAFLGRESIERKKLGNGLLVGFGGIYTSIISCKPTQPFTVRSLFLNLLIFFFFWSNGSWAFDLAPVITFFSNPHDQNWSVVMNLPVIRSEPSDLSDNSDLSSLSHLFFYYLFTIYTTIFTICTFFFTQTL